MWFSAHFLFSCVAFYDGGLVWFVDFAVGLGDLSTKRAVTSSDVEETLPHHQTPGTLPSWLCCALQLFWERFCFSNPVKLFMLIFSRESEFHFDSFVVVSSRVIMAITMFRALSQIYIYMHIFYFIWWNIMFVVGTSVSLQYKGENKSENISTNWSERAADRPESILLSLCL